MRQFLSIMVLAFGLCSPAFADKYDDEMAARRAKAEQGDPKAQVDLGTAYAFGILVPKDVAEGVKWFRKAAEQGNSAAQFFLGRGYYEGIGVRQSFAEAFKWIRKSAEQGDSYAAWHIGMMYEQGQGVPRDYVTAYMWYSIGAAKGIDEARTALDSLETKLTAGQLAEAQKMAREWQPVPPLPALP